MADIVAWVGEPLSDLESITPLGLSSPNWAGLRSRAGVEGLAAVALALTAMLVQLPGGQVWGAALVMVGALSLRPVHPRVRTAALALGLVRGMALIGFGVALWLTSDEGIWLIGALAGVAVVLFGVLRLLITPVQRRGERGWWISSSVATVGGGLMVVLFSVELLEMAVFVLAAGIGALGLISITSCLWGEEASQVVLGDGAGRAWDRLLLRPEQVDGVEQLRAAMMTDGPDVDRRMSRFYVLMAFAAVIASMGVILDSTAVVIGAMLIAPLMGPLMGTALALGMGWSKLLMRHALMAAGGSALAVLIGALLGSVLPTSLDLAVNSQVLSRTQPTLLDLVVAMAAGAAGAFALSRPDISASLPGVAIAISLVPPLTVVGLSWQAGGLVEGAGALLLFLTNATAIVLVGGVTLVFTGLIPVRQVAAVRQRVRTFTAGLLALGAIVLLGLSVNGLVVTEQRTEGEAATAAVGEWLSDRSDFTVDSVVVDGDKVEVEVAGTSPGPPPDRLLKLLRDELGDDVELHLRTREQSTTRLGGPAD